MLGSVAAAARERGQDRRLAKAKEIIIGTKLFVGNLNFKTTQKEVEDLFSELGELEDVFLPMDRATGRPRGFAFVTYVDSDAATEAMKKFDGHDFAGRPLRVNEASERPPRRSPASFDDQDDFFGGGGRGGGGGGGSKPPGKPKGSRRNMRAKKRSL